MNVLPTYGFCATCIDLLENVGSLSCANVPNVNLAHGTRAKSFKILIFT